MQHHSPAPCDSQRCEAQLNEPENTTWTNSAAILSLCIMGNMNHTVVTHIDIQAINNQTMQPANALQRNLIWGSRRQVAADIQKPFRQPVFPSLPHVSVRLGPHSLVFVMLCCDASKIPEEFAAQKHD